jgi:hypothetical protein
VNVLASDTGNDLTLTSVTTPAHGTAVIEDGEVLYTAVSSYVGADALTYTVTDAIGATASATITLTVQPVGTARGDVHVTTFDGLTYGFQALGDFVLTRSTVPGDTFEIDIATVMLPGWAGASFTGEAAAHVGSDLVTFSTGRDQVVWVDGVPETGLSASNPVLPLAGGQLYELSASTFELSWITGETLTVTDAGPFLDTAVTLPATATPGSVQGLLGGDSGQTNDFQLPGGGILRQPLSDSELLGAFANAWRLTPSAALVDGLPPPGTPVVAGQTQSVAPESAMGSRFTPLTSATFVDLTPAQRLGPAGSPAVSTGGGATTTVPQVFSPSSGGASTTSAGLDAFGRALTTASPDETTGFANTTGAAASDSPPAAASGTTAPASTPPADDGSDAVVSEAVSPDSGSLDIANAPTGGERQRMTSEAGATTIATSLPDFTTDVLEALAQFLYAGLFGPYFHPGEVRYPWGSNGANEKAPVPGYLSSADYPGLPATANDTVFTSAHYTGLLGRPSDAEETTFQTAAPPALNANGIANVARPDSGGIAGGLIVRPDPAPGLPVESTSPHTLASASLPVAFTSDGTATSVVFSVAFNPALLAIVGATAAASLPTGSTVGFGTTALADGLNQATVTVRSPTALPAGIAPLINLTAQVPATAAYDATEVLNLNIVSVNGVAQALPETAGLRVVGSVGDAGAGGTFAAAHGALILRVVGGADSGSAVWRGLAPPDTAGPDGKSTSGASPEGETEFAIYNGITLTVNAPAPFVFTPASLRTAAGDKVTVPVTLDQAVALTHATITLRHDPTALTLIAVRADPDSGLTVTVDRGSNGLASKGLVTVTVSQSATASVTGVLALFDFQVASTVRPGSNLALDLSAVTLDGQNLVPLEAEDAGAPVTPAAPVIIMSAGSDDGVVIAASSPTRRAQALFLSGAAA